MDDRAISNASLVRQIAREGKRWRLIPDVTEDGRVGVARVDHRAEAHFGLGEVVEDSPYRLCSVSDDWPFSAVLWNRVNNGEVDLARAYKLARKRAQEAERAVFDARREEARRLWRSRRKIVALPTGIVPAGLTNRSKR
jgi:hypothetical protein